MAGGRSRRKGKGGERELARLFCDEGFRARRGAQHRGGPDSPDVLVDDLPRLHVECKRTERLRIYDAVDQAARDAGPDQVPVVAFRSNECRWLAILDLRDFLGIVRESDLCSGGLGGPPITN